MEREWVGEGVGGRGSGVEREWVRRRGQSNKGDSLHSLALTERERLTGFS